MQLSLVVVGRGAPELSGYESRFVKRLNGMIGFKLVELSEGRARQSVQRKQEEGRLILQQVKNSPYILLDEMGSQHSSTDWADFLARQPGSATLAFVIGGADGIDRKVRESAAYCWSLSRLTLPHQLARVFVLEQLYRALSINQGHPYHRP